MALRVDTTRTAPADLPVPAFDLVPPTPSKPPAAPDPDAVMLADSLRRFVDASRAEEKAGRLAALGSIVASPADVDAQRSARIRAFFDKLNVEVPVLAGEPGETRRVAVPFRMSHESTNAGYNAALLEALGSSPSRARAGLVIAGRATPEQIGAVVRDLAELHPEEFGPDKSAEQVRNYLRDLGVGIDCAGSVQLALFESRGLSPESGKAHFGMRPRLNEDLTQLDGKPQFARVADPANLRPSDLIILKPPRGESVGHTVIVTDQTPATLTEAEAKALSREFPALAVTGKPVVKVSVASSFGYEGPQERVWVYDPETKSWGDLGGRLFDDDGAGRRTEVNSRAHSGPWDHDIQGMYHAR
jgi:hypothetical protein